MDLLQMRPSAAPVSLPKCLFIFFVFFCWRPSGELGVRLLCFSPDFWPVPAEVLSGALLVVLSQCCVICWAYCCMFLSLYLHFCHID